MIDLHIKTKLSNGEYNSKELLSIIDNLNLQIFSITDDDHCLAYTDLTLAKHPHLITGVVFTTSIDGLFINIIGYEVNPIIINQFYYDRYSKDSIEKREYIYFNKLTSLMKKNNVAISPRLELSLIEKGISKKTVYYDAKKNNPDFPFDTFKDFFRDGLSNPFSNYFLDESEIHPCLADVLNVIEKAGGQAFLAHPYDYGVDVDSLIEKLIIEGIDGIEVFHPSAAMRQSLKLIDICLKNDLRASGGSNFKHSRYHIPLGINVHEKLFDYKCFDWLEKYR